MRELKLKYFIDLASNVGAKSKADAKLLQEAQQVMAAAITGTNNKFLDYNKLSLLAGKNTGLMKEVLTGTTDKFAALERVMSRVGQNTSLERQVGYMQRLSDATDRAIARAQTYRTIASKALANAPETAAAVAGGYYGAKRVMAPPLRAYSSLEAATTDLRISMLDKNGKVSPDFGRISAEAVALGNQLPGTTKDFMLAARALQTQGVPSSVVAGGGLRASSYVGALLDVNQSSAAEVIAKLREAHGLKDNELVPMADLVQRAFFGFGIKPQEYLESAKYSAATFNTMGISGLEKTRQTLAIQGMAANVGLEASSFGTNYAQMLTRLSQIDPRLAKKSKEAREAKAMLGEHGIAMSFYDDQGAFKGNLNMLEQLAKLRKLNPLEQTRVLHTLFGTEGGRPAQIMVQKGLEGYRQALGTLDNQAGLDARLAMRMETFASKLEALSGTIENVMAKIGAQAGRELKPVMDGANNVIGGAVGDFFDAHPTAGTAGIVGAGGLVAWLTGRMGSGMAKAFLGRGAAAAAGVAAESGLAAGAAGAAGAGGLGATLGAVLGIPLAGAFAVERWNQVYEGVQGHLELGQRQPARLLPWTPTTLPAGTDFMSLTRPPAVGENTFGSIPGLGASDLRLGDGKLTVDVQVHDDRVSATARVDKPLNMLRIDAGNTNPAGYRSPP